MCQPIRGQYLEGSGPMRAVDSACHTEGEERFPSEPVTPTPDVERQEDGHRVFRDGDYVVEADHLDNKQSDPATVGDQNKNVEENRPPLEYNYFY